jgi:hypothetical protein
MLETASGLAFILLVIPLDAVRPYQAAEHGRRRPGRQIRQPESVAFFLGAPVGADELQICSC